MIALPAHAPCGSHGLGDLSEHALDVECTTVRTFTMAGVDAEGKPKHEPHDTPGCHAVSSVCTHCGLRAIWNGGACSACATDPNAGRLR